MSGRATRRRLCALLPPTGGRGAVTASAIGAIAFAAGLGAIGGLAAGRAADGWRARLDGSATVAVRAFGLESPEAAQARTAETLLGVRGVSAARALDPAAADDLVARLIAGGPASIRTPGARLLGVTFTPGSPSTATDMARALRAEGLDASVDDHGLKTSPLIHAAAVAILSAAALGALIAIAIGAVAAMAARQGLAQARDLARLLRTLGATDGFIAGLFQARSGRLAAWGASAGAIAAMLAAAAWRVFGGDKGVTALAPLGWADLAAAAPVPLVAALIAAGAARSAARAALERAM